MAPVRRERFDLAIVGCGFSGALLARLLARRGRRVALFERDRHPRFALGESSTPLAAIALERVARAHRLPELAAFATWGRWRDVHPELACGLKRGFTFYGHDRGSRFANGSVDERRLLVAASPDDEVADVHWRRADVDARFAQRARADGVALFEEAGLSELELTSRGARFAVRQGRRKLVLEAELVVDASGPAAAVAKAGGALPLEAGELRTLVYGHFAGVESFDIAAAPGARFEPGPYPDHRAAVHHLFDGGWAYVLPFDDGVVSAGFVLRDPPAAEEPDEVWRVALSTLPSLAHAFRGATAVVGPRIDRGLRRRLDRATGDSWVALPHAFSFVDPLFSTGIAWSLVAVERLAGFLAPERGQALDRGRLAERLERYERLLAAEHEQILALVRGAERRFGEFDAFVAWAKLYFVVASWCEVRQRLLDPPDAAWEGFLGADDERLAGIFARGGAIADSGAGELGAWIADAVADRDLVGLTVQRPGRRIGVDLDALVERSGRLGVSHDELRAALPRLRGIDPEAKRAASRP